MNVKNEENHDETNEVIQVLEMIEKLKCRILLWLYLIYLIEFLLYSDIFFDITKCFMELLKKQKMKDLFYVSFDKCFGLCFSISW
jgi:hypothetical protein